MGWIQNISMQRVKDGDHTNPGKNSMLIQKLIQEFQND